MPAHDFLDLSITYHNKDWQASLYVKNIRDNVFIEHGSSKCASRGRSICNLYDPRTGEYHLAETLDKLKKKRVGFPAFFYL